MIKYLITVKIKDNQKERIIKNNIYRHFHLTDEELEEAVRNFCKSVKDVYASDGSNIEILENSIGVVE